MGEAADALLNMALDMDDYISWGGGDYSGYSGFCRNPNYYHTQFKADLLYQTEKAYFVQYGGYSFWIPKALCRNPTINHTTEKLSCLLWDKFLYKIEAEIIDRDEEPGTDDSTIITKYQAEDYQDNQASTDAWKNHLIAQQYDAKQQDDRMEFLVANDKEELDVSSMVSRKKRTVGACHNSAESVDCSHMKGAGSKHKKVDNSWHPKTDDFGGF